MAGVSIYHIMKCLRKTVLLSFVGLLCRPLFALEPAPAELNPTAIIIHADQVVHPISPTLNGVFFEDINFGADGGLYSEHVKNGSFEFSPDALMGWHKVERAGGTGQLAVLDEHPLNPNNPHYVRMSVDAAPNGNPDAGFGFTNEGYRGMGIVKGQKYLFSVYARSVGDQPMTLTIEIQDHSNRRMGSADLSGFSRDWQKQSVELETSATDDHAHLVVFAKTAGSIDMDMVSLFPQDTWQHRPGGLRADLVQLLKDLHPKFMRFPGGCIVEGKYLTNRYQWKNTIGSLAERKLILNRWNMEFGHRLAPDYFQSYGIGFFEYFQLCEDIGASPLPILNCGMACQYNSGELAPLDQLEPYIQDALDLIEFANGPADAGWGKKRAEMGHTEPFNLQMIGVGNEQWGAHYIERYQRMSAAIKAKHPEIKLISAAGPSPSGPLFNYAWNELTKLNADIVDEHYYARPEWFLANTHRYDSYDRSRPKVFAGEFAAQSVGTGNPANRNNWECALAEAAFMTGLERNSDIVAMASYAPLLAHVDAWQWRPDLIWFDNLRSFGTPSYYVQKLFSVNAGSSLIASDVSGPADHLFTTASHDDKTGDVILKAVNVQAGSRPLKVSVQGMATVESITGTAEVLASADLKVENTLDEPTKLAPVSSELGKVSPEFTRELPGYSVTVIRLRGGR